MTRLEVKELVDLIVIHRPFFKSRLGDKIYQDLLVEWSRIMEPYDFEDIKANLETFLKDENNYGREPDAYQLIRGAMTTKTKQDNSKGLVGCQFCGRMLNQLQMQQHEARCRSIQYLRRLYKNYFNKDLADLEKAYNINDADFNKSYIEVMERVLPLVKNESERRSMSNVIETYYGREPKFKVNEI